MTPTAVVMLLGSGLMLWGGLAWSLMRLRKHPDLPEAPEGSTAPAPSTPST